MKKIKIKNLFKINLKTIIIIIMTSLLVGGTTAFATYNYLAKDIEYKKSDGTKISVNDALNDLYSKTSTPFNYNNLSLFKGTNSINVEIGKKYIISIAVTSYSNQAYEPSIKSGCQIEKSTTTISNTYEELYATEIAYVVTATSNIITISGNLEDANWNFISCYKIN